MTTAIYCSTLEVVEPIKLAYIAGIFDGEGHLSIRLQDKKNGHYCISLAADITNQHKETLEWIRENIGGSLYSSKTKSRKNICYTLQIRNIRHLKWFINAIIPYLRIKQDEAVLMIEACNKVLPHPGTSKGKNRKIAAKSHEDNYFNQFRILEQKIKDVRHGKQTPCGTLCQSVNSR